MTQTADPGYLLHLDPRDLTVHPGNLRKDVGELDELQASIAATGVLQALTVVHEGDTYLIRAGHRRCAAAVAAIESGQWPADRPTTVPCLVVRATDDAAVDALVTMIAENEHRSDLKKSEVADGYAQLAAFDLSASEIARRTGKPVAAVRTGLKLATMPEEVRRFADEGKIALDDLVKLEAFAHDKQALARILKDANSPWGIRHKIEAEERKRRDAEALAKLRKELSDAGVKIVPKPKDWPWRCKAAPVTELRDADGNELDPETVKTQEGFAAIIDKDYYGPHEAKIVCLDPEAMGLKRTRQTSYKTPEQQAAEAAAEVARQARSAALDDARSVRREFVLTTFGSVKGWKDLASEAIATAALNPSFLLLARDEVNLRDNLFGGPVDAEAAAAASRDRLTRMLVARYIAARESNLTSIGQRGITFSTHPSDAIAWLDLLVGQGYELSNAESDLRSDLAQRVRPSEHDQDEDEDDEDESDEDEDDDWGDHDDDPEPVPAAALDDEDHADDEEPMVPVTGCPDVKADPLTAQVLARRLAEGHITPDELRDTVDGKHNTLGSPTS